MRSFLTLSLLAGLTTAFPTTSPSALTIAKRIVARAPPEAKAVLKSVSSSGTGCAPNSAAFIIKDDAVLAFDSLIVDSSSPASSSKQCLITIDLALDPKWKYTINRRSGVRGWTDGASANFKAVYTVSGKSVRKNQPPSAAKYFLLMWRAQSQVGAEIKPSTSDGNYVVNLTQAGAASAYGGGVATIDISLALVKVPGKEGIVTVDSIDIGFEYSK